MQNHSEVLDHGIYVWDLKKNTAEFVEIKNDTGFYTILVESGKFSKLPSNLPKNLFLRIKHKNTQQSEIKSIISEIKQSHNLVEVSVQKIQDYGDSVLQNRKLNSVDVRNVDYQNSILEDYIKTKFEVKNDTVLRLTELNRELNKQLTKSDLPRNSMWIPKMFMFDNMFSYGKGNCIDFTNMDGIYGLFAKNASGKSSFLSAITYCIFDKCSKTGKSSQVMNNKSSSFNCKLIFELNGKEYTIERKGFKQKYGNVKVNVDFFYKDDLNQEISLNGKDRSETNANIRSILGDYEDFILTTLSTQDNNTGFIDMSQSDRKTLLCQFLDINIYEELYNIANNESKELYILLRDSQRKDYNELLKNIKVDIEKYEKIIEILKSEKDSLLKISKELNENILIKTKDLIKIKEDLDSNLDIQDLKDSKKSIESGSKKISDLIDKNSNQRSILIEKLEKLKSENNLIDIELIKKSIEEKEKLKYSLHDLKLIFSKKHSEFNHKNEKMIKLKELKYDENCEFCMNNIFVKDAIETKKSIKENEKEIEKLTEEIKKIEINLKKYDSIEKEKSIYDKNLIQINKFSVEKNEFDAEENRLKTKSYDAIVLLTSIEKKIEDYEKQKVALENNKKINLEIQSLTKQKKEVDNKILKTEESLTEALINQKLSLKLKEEYEKGITDSEILELKFKDYQYYLDAVHRDGIPHTLISGTIPQIEEEINNILNQIVDFSIVLEASDKNINCYIIYDQDNYWPLELTSGMEKFISSIAIRVALINISTLPRPNFIAIDEGFSVLDQRNLGSLSMMFDYLRTQFKFLMIISHLESMRDIVDSIIEIEKIKGRSKLEKL